jgi:hypothetical protein
LGQQPVQATNTQHVHPSDHSVIDTLLKRIKELEARPTGIVINNNNTTNNFHLNTFGFESIKHIMSDKEFMTNMFKNQPTSYVKLMEKLHFDPGHPENKTVRITNKKEPYMEVYDNKVGWRAQPQNTVLDDMINNSKNMIEEHLYDNEEELHLRFRDTQIFDKAMCTLRGVKDYLSGEVEINDKVRNMVKAMKQEARAMVMTYKTINTED